MLILTASLFTGWPPRSLAGDARRLLAMHQPMPQLHGLEHIPAHGAFTLIANHHQRKGLWIGWVGALLADGVYRVRQTEPPFRALVTDAQAIQWGVRSFMLPTSRWFLRRAARFWQMIPLPQAGTHTTQSTAEVIGQAVALRTALRTLQQGTPLLVFPEGTTGQAGTLQPALIGTGTFLARAQSYGPILPVAFWEAGEQLVGQVGSAIAPLSGDDAANRRIIMQSIAQLHPDQR